MQKNLLTKNDTKEEKLRVVEYFGGIGAVRKALERLNIPFEVVDYVEIDENAVKSYNAMYGTNFEPQDIKTWNKDLKDIDLIMHGSPCTNFSTAGKQEGGNEGSGTASSLMYETLRNVLRLYPKYVIWENVKNLISDEHRPNFYKYINIMSEFGYNNYYQVLNAKDYGIPQNRERIFTVSIRKDIDEKAFEFPKKKFLNITLKDILETDVDEKYYLTTPKLISISKWKAYQKPLENVLGQNSIAPTLTARGAGEEHSGMITYSEDLDETTNIQEELEKYVLNDQLEYKGKIVNLPAVCASRGRKTDNEDDETKLQQIIEVNTNGLSNTLTTVEKDNYVIEKNKKQLLCEHLIDNDMVEPYDVIKHGYTDKRFETLENGKDIVTSKNIAPTITTRPDELGVAVESSSDLLDVGDLGLRIRKLTPKECWRLMGFDDEDYEKASMVNGSSALYKQAGNSIVVDVLMAILDSLLRVTRTAYKHFKFPDKQVLTKSYKDLLEPEYDANLVVLNDDELKMVKDFGATYSFGGYVVKEDIYPTITASYGKTSGNSGKIPCREGFRILTPKEAWRFMGFDDEDYENASKVNGPAALYKQAGNSIVVPVLEGILKNLLDIKNIKPQYRIYKQHEIIELIAKALLSPKTIDDEGNASVEFWVRDGSFFLTIENYNELEDALYQLQFESGKVNQFVVKLLEIAVIKAQELEYTRKTAKEIIINISEIIDILNPECDPSIQYNRADYKDQCLTAIQILKNVKIKFRNDDGTYSEIRICKDKTNFDKKDRYTLHFWLSDELNQILRYEGKDTAIPLEVLRFNEKYDQNYYLVFKKILSNIGTSPKTTITVKELYRYCVTLARVEDVARTNRAYTQRIRRPLEAVLNKLNTYFEWEYEDTDDMTFNDWLENAKIKIKWKDEIKNITKVA